MSTTNDVAPSPADFYARLVNLPSTTPWADTTERNPAPPSVAERGGDERPVTGLGAATAPPSAAASQAGSGVAPPSTVFRSSGWHVLGEYRPSVGSGGAGGVGGGAGRGAGTWHHAGDDDGGGGAAAARAQDGPVIREGGGGGPLGRPTAIKTAPPRAYGQQLGSANLGFQLLQRAGWEHGMGLGVHEQGRTEPVGAHLNKGHRGIGFDSRAAQEQQRQATEAAAAVERAAGRRERQAARAEARERRKRITDVLEKEMAKEDVDTKVKRYKQIEKQEEEDARGKAISRYIHQAFNDPYDSLTSADTNPLGRRNRLTAFNPLLDDDGDA